MRNHLLRAMNSEHCPRALSKSWLTPKQRRNQPFLCVPPDPNLAQALHTLNGDVVALKIRDAKGRVSKLVAAKKPHDEIVDELYLAALSRLPSDEEKQASRELLADASTPADFYQDLLWALMNSKQFLFVH